MSNKLLTQQAIWAALIAGETIAHNDVLYKFYNDI